MSLNQSLQSLAVFACSGAAGFAAGVSIREVGFSDHTLVLLTLTVALTTLHRTYYVMSHARTDR